MSPIETLSLIETDFSLEAQSEDRQMLVSFRGQADMQSVERLSSYMNELHREALARGIAEVVFDVQELQFLNSSCFKLFINWIAMVARADPKYRITFVGNPAVGWQKRSLGALRCVAEQIVNLKGLETQRPGPTDRSRGD